MDIHHVVFWYSGIVCLFVSSWLPRLLNDVQLMHHFLKTFLFSQKKFCFLKQGLHISLLDLCICNSKKLFTDRWILCCDVLCLFCTQLVAFNHSISVL